MECTSNSIVSSRGRKIKINQSQDFVYYYYVPSKRSKSSNTQSNNVEVKKQNDCTKNKESNKQKTDDSSDDDVEVTGYTELSSLTYAPVNFQWQQIICQYLNLKLYRGFNSVLSRPLQLPSQTKTIKMDGNCLFRCLSYVITGSEDQHFVIRQKIVECFKTNNKVIEHFKSFGIQDIYLKKRNMINNGVWGTADEIKAATAILNTNIYIYHTIYSRWIIYKNLNLTSGPNFVEVNGIYLKNIGDVHFEVVTDIE